MKISVSARVDESLVTYLDHYKETHQLKTRSEALERAIEALRAENLKQEYAQAMAELDAEGDVFDVTARDGLEHEAW